MAIGGARVLSQPVKIIVATKDQRQAADPQHSVWVSANAGSGKTQVLVQRVIRLLLEGVEPASILCITYTKAAAAEMADRLYSQLASWVALSDEKLTEAINNLGADGKSQTILIRARKLFTLALETPGGLKIQTIHAFCERLLHLFPVEADLAPGFSVLEDRNADELRERAMAQVIYGHRALPETLQAFDTLSNRVNNEQFATVIKEFIAGLRKTDPAVLDLSAEAYALLLKQSAGLLPSETYDEIYADFIRIDQLTYARGAAALAGYPTHKNVPEKLLKISTSTDIMDDLLSYYFTAEKSLRKSLFSVKMNTDHPDVTEFITNEASRLDQLLLRLNSLELIEANTQAFIIASAALRQIEEEKQKSAKVDFDDLIRRTAQLLSTSRARDWVTFKLDPGLSHILLDESQDTGPAQWIIINRLAEEFFAGLGREQKAPRTLFVVGDEKQSIFSFQGADVVSYADAREKHVNFGNLKNVTLNVSYRSTDVILEAVDKVHTPQTDPQKVLRSHTASRKDTLGIVEIWPLIAPDDKPVGQPWDTPLDHIPQSSPRRKLARMMAQRVKLWIDPQAPRKLAGKDKAVSAGDILILFRSRGPLFRMVMAELRAAGVPVAGADRLSLLQSLIVQDVLALLNWLLLTQDDHALACILKSPLVPEPLSEPELFAAAYDRKSTSLLSRLSGENLNWLKRLQAAVLTSTPDELLALIFNHCRKDIAARLGPEAHEASDAMLDMALAFQAEGGASLFGFVQWFQGTETTLKREMAKPSGEVRLMTVHGAKGLEAPIVIIADAAQSPSGANGRPRILEFSPRPGLTLPLWFASGTGTLVPEFGKLEDLAKALELEESRRLLYVAMTRAEDELYLTGVGQGSKGEAAKESWWVKIVGSLGAPVADVPLRFGATDVYLQPAGPTAPAQPLMPPAWLLETPAIERNNKFIGLNAALSGNRTYDAAAAKRGRARHRLLQDLGDMPEAARAAFAAKRASQLGLQDAEAQKLVTALAKPELAPYFGPDSRAEEEIWGTLEQTGQRVAGRLDRLAVRPEGLWLLDYKTGTAASPDHLKQMAGYAALLKQAFPTHPITAALFFTQTASLQQLTEAELNAALRESDVASP